MRNNTGLQDIALAGSFGVFLTFATQSQAKGRSSLG